MRKFLQAMAAVSFLALLLSGQALAGQTYYQVDDAYYQPVTQDGTTV